MWGHAAGTGLPALRGSTRRARADADDPEEPDANAGRRGIEAMCTLPVAGAIEVSSALTGPVLHKPAAMTSTPATVALVMKALAARRRGVVELGVPIDLMFRCYLPGVPAKTWFNATAGTAVAIGLSAGPAAGLSDTAHYAVRTGKPGPNEPLPVEPSAMSSHGDDVCTEAARDAYDSWKSANLVAGLRVLDHDDLGFWERNGYHDRGDPWLEQCYQGD